MTKWKNAAKPYPESAGLVTCIVTDCGQRWWSPLPAPVPRLCPECRARHQRILALRERMGEPEGRTYRVVTG